MNFFETNQVQFWKYLVLNESPSGAPYISRGYSHDLTTVVGETAGSQSVFFRCPALDYMCTTVKGNTSRTSATTTLVSQGYTKAWVNSNRVKQNTGTKFEMGVIYTQTDDEDCYAYTTQAYFTIDTALCRYVSVTLYCGGENRLASLDDLNRIWMGMGTKDHHDCIDDAYSGIYENRISMMPTWDYYYDGWSSVDPSDDISTDNDDGRTSLYNCQGGYSGSVILTPKPLLGNMVLMKDIWVPIILTGGLSGSSRSDGELIKTPINTTDNEYNMWPEYYIMIGDEEDVIGVTQFSDYRKTYKDFIFNIKIKNTTGTVICDTNFHSKAIQLPSMYLYKVGSTEDAKGNNSTNTVSNYLMGKRFVECCIPKYVCGANYSGDSNFFKGKLTQEVTLYDPYSKYNEEEPYNMFYNEETDEAYLSLVVVDTRENYAGAANQYDFDFDNRTIPQVYWPAAYGGYSQIIYAITSSSAAALMTIYQRYDGSFSGYTDSTTRNYSANIFLNNVEFSVTSTKKTQEKSSSNTVRYAGYAGQDFEISLSQCIPYFDNVGIKVSGIFGAYGDSNSKLLCFYYGSCKELYAGKSYTALPAAYNYRYAYTNIDLVEITYNDNVDQSLETLYIYITNIAV